MEPNICKFCGRDKNCNPFHDEEACLLNRIAELEDKLLHSDRKEIEACYRKIEVLEQDISDMDKENDRLLQENERLRKYQLKVLDYQYRQGMERALELCANHESIGAAEESIRAEIEYEEPWVTESPDLP